MRSTSLSFLTCTALLAALGRGQAAPQRPLLFEANRGQASGAVDYLCRQEGYTLLLRADGATMRLRGRSPLETRFVGADPEARSLPIGPRGASVHYYRGPAADWITDVATWRAVRFEEVWPGIDVVYHDRNGPLEYDFVVAPGADARVVRMRFSGQRPRIDANGALVIAVPGGRVRHARPVAYQTVGGERRAVAARFRLDGEDVTFELGDFDPERELVIDPILYATYLGGNQSDTVESMVVDGGGNIWLFGQTESPDFPVRNAIHGRKKSSDCFVSKFAPDGKRLLFSTYLGGDRVEEAERMTLMADGSVAVVGLTSSLDFPTKNGFKTSGVTLGGFLSVIGKNGGLSYSTYITGTQGAGGRATCVAAVGKQVFVGVSGATADFVIRGAAFQRKVKGTGDIWIGKFDVSLSGDKSLVASTFLGGTRGFEIPVDMVADSNSVAVTGTTNNVDFPTKRSLQRMKGVYDVFLTEFLLDLTDIRGSTFLGGSGPDDVEDLDQDFSGLVVVGKTQSRDFPLVKPVDTTLQGTEAFVTSLDFVNQTTEVGISTFLGGSGADHAFSVSAKSPLIFVAGVTTSRDFPRAFDIRTGSRGRPNPFVVALKPLTRKIELATLIGNNGGGVPTALIAARNATDTTIHVAGTASISIPATAGAFQPKKKAASDGFYMRLSLPRASATTYGQGARGKLGTPRLLLFNRNGSRAPVVGNTGLELELENVSGHDTVALLLIGSKKASVRAFGAEILVFPDIALLAIPLPRNGTKIPFGIPDDRSLCGEKLFLQMMHFDRSLVRDFFAFTAGLELRIGVSL